MKDRHTDPSTSLDRSSANVNPIQNGETLQTPGKGVMDQNDLDKGIKGDKINDLSKGTTDVVLKNQEPEKLNKHKDGLKEKTSDKTNEKDTGKYDYANQNVNDKEESKLSFQMEKLSVSSVSCEDKLIEATSKLSLADDKSSNDRKNEEVTLNGEVQTRGPSGGVPRIVPFQNQSYKSFDANLLSYQSPVKYSKGGKRTMDCDEYQDSYQKYTKPFDIPLQYNNFSNFVYEDTHYMNQGRDNLCGGKMVVKSPTDTLPQAPEFPQDSFADKFLEEVLANPENVQLPMMAPYPTDGEIFPPQQHCQYPLQPPAYAPVHNLNGSLVTNGNVNVNMLPTTGMGMPPNGYQEYPVRTTQNIPEVGLDNNFTSESFTEMQKKEKQDYISETESDIEKSPYSLTSPSSVSSVSLNSPPPSNLSHDSGYGGMNALSPASDYMVKSPPSRPPSKSGSSPPSDSSCWSEYSMKSPSPVEPIPTKSNFIDQNLMTLQDVYHVIGDDMKHDSELRRQQKTVSQNVNQQPQVQQNASCQAISNIPAPQQKQQISPPVMVNSQRVMPVKVGPFPTNSQVMGPQNGFPPQPVTTNKAVAHSPQQNAPVIILPPVTQPQMNGLPNPGVSQPITTSTGSFVIVPGSAPGITSTPVPLPPPNGTTPQNTIIIVAPHTPVPQAPKDKPKLREIRPKLPTADGKNGAMSPTSLKQQSPGTNGPKLGAPAQRLNQGAQNQNQKRIEQRQQPQNLINVARRMVAEISRDQLPYQDEEGDTYLHVAVCKTEPNMVLALLERLMRENMSPMIDVENNKRQTPLYLAVVANQSKMVRMFVQHNANPNTMAQVKLQDGNTIVKAPIHAASSNGVEFLSTLQELLKSQDLSLNIENSDGLTALHCAIQAHGRQMRNATSVIDSIPIIQTLIKAGADPRSQDKKSGKTPLMYAIEKRDYSLVETMIRLFEPSKLRNIVRLSTFDGSSCLKIAESLKNDYPQDLWPKLMSLLSGAYNGQLPLGISSY